MSDTPREPEVEEQLVEAVFPQVMAPETGVSTTTPVRMIAGRYRLLSTLGKGGMGVVFEAEDGVLGRKLAIKELALSRSDANAHARFLREARLLGALTHSHIVTVYDWVAVPGEVPCIVMEFLRGQTLAARLSVGGRILPLEACILISQCLDALAFMHHRGIVHRDLKPANIFLCSDRPSVPWAKILDFGLATLFDSSEHPEEFRTEAGGLRYATPEYAPLEQLLGGATDHRIDIFALGVTLYEALTGERPFRRGEPRTLDGEAPLIDEVRMGLPPGLSRVVARAMAPKPADRFATAKEFAAALAPFMATAPALPGAKPEGRRTYFYAIVPATIVALSGLALHRLSTPPALVPTPTPTPTLSASINPAIPAPISVPPTVEHGPVVVPSASGSRDTQPPAHKPPNQKPANVRAKDAAEAELKKQRELATLERERQREAEEAGRRQREEEERQRVLNNRLSDVCPKARDKCCESCRNTPFRDDCAKACDAQNEACCAQSTGGSCINRSSCP